MRYKVLNYAAISSVMGGGANLIIFLGTRVFEKNAEHLFLFSKGQSMIFQQGVNFSNFLTALMLMPCSWIISLRHSIHCISRKV